MKADLQLVICELNQADLTILRRNTEALTNIVHDNAGTVFHIISNFIICTFDFGQESPELSARSRFNAVEEILLKIGTDVRLLHGAVPGTYESMGSAERISFGPVLWDVRELLTRLSTIPWGRSGLIDP